MNFLIGQSIKELKYIMSSIKKDFKIIPVNLETYLFAKDNNLKIIEPSNFIKNDDHRKFILKGKEVEKLFFFKRNVDNNIKYEINAFFRNKYFAYIYIQKILKIVLRNNKNFIYISGWPNTLSEVDDEIIISDIVRNIVPVSKLISMDEKEKINSNQKNYVYYARNIKNIRSTERRIILNNIGYNFKRLCFLCFYRGIKIYFPTFEKISFFKKIIYFFIGIKPIYLEKKIINKKIYKFFKVNYKKKYSIINFFYKKSLLYLNSIYNKNSSIKKILKKTQFNLILLNISKGVDGSLGCKINNKKLNSICVSHGTIARAFNRYDKVYKKNIAAAVFSGDSKYFAIQSKIVKNSLASHKIKGRKLITGNLIFSEGQFIKNKKKENILYATTLKDFHNIQFLGVEMFYEYYNNLIFLNSLALKMKYNIIVKIHPTESKSLSILKKIFTNLIFSNDNISKLLKKSFVTISFSSTVIEDSLNTGVPVILFDPWKRYQHCEAEKNIKKINEAIYYLNDKKKIIKLINTIAKSKKYNFKKYVYNTSSKNNFKHNILNLAQ